MPSSGVAEAAPALDVASGMSKDRSSNASWLANQRRQTSSAAPQSQPPPAPAAAAAKAKQHAGSANRLRAMASSAHAGDVSFTNSSKSSKVKGIPESVMQQAYLSKQDPVSGRLRCKACGKAFELYRQLGQHLLEKHDGMNSQDAKFLKLQDPSQYSNQPSLLQQQQQRLQLESADAFPALGASSSAIVEARKPATSAAAAAGAAIVMPSRSQPPPAEAKQQQQQQQQEGKQPRKHLPVKSPLISSVTASKVASTASGKPASQAACSPSSQPEAPSARSLGQFSIFDFIKKPKPARAAAAKASATSKGHAKGVAASKTQAQLSPGQLVAIMEAAKEQVSCPYVCLVSCSRLTYRLRGL